jgi:hypothetical protein
MDEGPPNAETGLVAAPFPLASDTAQTAALFPADEDKTANERPKVAGKKPPDKKPAERKPAETADTGRVVAPYRTTTKPDADTGRVEVPFRQVEAPFPVDDRPVHSESTGTVSVPLAVSKLKGVPSSSSVDEDGSSEKPRPALFPIDAPPSAPMSAVAPAPAPSRAKGLGPREQKMVMLAGGIVIALGLATVWLFSSAGSGSQHSQVREASPAEKVRPGYLRVTALCGGMQIPAKLSMNGSDKGDTPVELPLPTAFPPGKHELELHLSARIGDPVDVTWAYHLPLDPSQPGKALEIEMYGCGGY